MASADDYTVFLAPQARDDLSRLSKPDQKKAIAFLERLPGTPTIGGLLKGLAGLRRKKLGRLRILYTLDPDKRQIIIRVIDLRDDDTYDKLEERLDWEPEVEEDN